MDAVFSIDTEARIQTWNSAAEQLYGYTAAEAIGQSLKLLAPDPTNYAPGERFLRVLQGEQIYFETSRRRKDGSLVEVGISSGPIRDPNGNVVGVSVVHRDISERKRSERDLHEIHQWLEMAQGAGDVAPWAYDSETGEVLTAIVPTAGLWSGRSHAVYVGVSRARTPRRSAASR